MCASNKYEIERMEETQKDLSTILINLIVDKICKINVKIFNDTIIAYRYRKNNNNNYRLKILMIPGEETDK